MSAVSSLPAFARCTLLGALLGALAIASPQVVAQGLNQPSPSDTPIGDAKQGEALIREIGCGSCHSIPGITGADGLVGPPLDHMGRRQFLAGILRNTPDNMLTWLRWPQSVVPGNAMPDMGLSAEQARAIAAYLYTLQ